MDKELFKINEAGKTVLETLGINPEREKYIDDMATNAIKLDSHTEAMVLLWEQSDTPQEFAFAIHCYAIEYLDYIGALKFHRP